MPNIHLKTKQTIKKKKKANYTSVEQWSGYVESWLILETKIIMYRKNMGEVNLEWD